MKYYAILIAVLLNNILNSQNIFEYGSSSDAVFKVYSEDENKLRKVQESTVFDLSSPEEITRRYFFATSNEDLSILFLDQDQFTPKDETHFDNIKNTPAEDMYVQLLHKTNYTFEGNQLAYIMFIARIKEVDFPFPTLLSLIKKEDKWLIHKRANQQKLTDCLMMFKPCVLSNLVDGTSQDTDIKELIDRTNNNGIDFTKLFNELVEIQNNDGLSTKLTMSKNMDCTTMPYKKEVKGEYYLTGIFNKTSIKRIRVQDEEIISQIKKNNDSIVLTSMLSFDYMDKTYSLVKYDRLATNGSITKEFLRLDQNINPEEPAKELIYLFENLMTDIFSDLTPGMNITPIMETPLYKESRGVYEVLNTTKLYNLLIDNKGMFSNYMY